MNEREKVIHLLKQCLEDWPYAATRVPTIMNRIEDAVAILEEVGEENIAKLRRRYPEGFDAERSLHREDV